jgi:hypothetical protein
MRNRISRRWFLERLTLGLGVTALGGSLAWWASAPAEPPQRKPQAATCSRRCPEGSSRPLRKQAAPKVEAVYRYAVAHEETLQYIPCVCGCGAIGHRHNAHCYVAERLPGGAITFTNHGAR